MNVNSRRDTLGIAEEAAQWLDALKSKDQDVNAAFVAWLRTSPRHVEEFLLLTASEQESDDMGFGRRIDTEGLEAALAGNVVPLESAVPVPKPKRARKSVTLRRFAVASSFVVALAGVAAAYFIGPGSWRSYTADIGEQRTVELADGSLIHLNARSRVIARLTKDRRDLQLLEGEALFEVARDAVRPFRVDASGVVIRALGTQFDVNRRADHTKVAVLEGAIEITAQERRSGERLAANGASAARLGAGEEARIGPSGEIVRARVNLSEATAWRQRRLVFRDNTLAEIADEFNRYNRSPQVVVADESLRRHRYGGTFDADEPESLAAFLRGVPGLTVRQENDRVVIRATR